jgi:hypothetical protein
MLDACPRRATASHMAAADESFTADTGAFNRVTAGREADERNGHVVREQNIVDYVTIVLNVFFRAPALKFLIVRSGAIRRRSAEGRLRRNRLP